MFSDSRTYNDPAEKRAANSKNERFNALKKLKNEKKRRAEEEQKKKTAESKTLKPSDIFSSGESSDEDGEKKYIDSDSDNESDDGEFWIQKSYRKNQKVSFWRFSKIF